MSKIEDLINELCPDGVEFRSLEQCCSILDNRRKPVTKSARVKGEYPYYGANGIQDYVSDYIFDGIFVLVGEDGSVVTPNGNPVVNWAEGKIWVNNHAHIIEEKDGILLRYLFHYIQTINVSALIHGNIPKLTGGDFRKLSIPLPPLPVQQEIVRILDNFTELTAELEAELTARKKQYEYYRNVLLSKDSWNNVPLGEVCKLITKGTTPKKYTTNGIRFIKTESFVNNFINNDKTMFISEATHYGELKRSILKEKDILFTIAGATIGKCASVEKMNLPANTNQALAIIRLNQEVANQRFIFHILQSKRMSDYIKIKVKGSAQPNLNLQQINEFLVPVPSLEEQERIVAILDRFDTLCNDLTSGLPAEIAARRKQYEYYRDKLLTFKEASS